MHVHQNQLRQLVISERITSVSDAQIQNRGGRAGATKEASDTGLTYSLGAQGDF